MKRIDWVEVACTLTVTALLTGFFLWGVHQIPAGDSSAVTGTVQGQP